MTPEELVEAVRDALRAECKARYGSTWSFDDSERFARAAIAVVREAMAEPDKAMLDEGREASTAWGTYRLMLAASPLRATRPANPERRS